MKEKRLRIPALRGCALLLALAAFDVRLRAAPYEIITEETSAPVCLAVLPDLHSCAYGKGQRTLLAAVAAEIPDAVLLTGDIVDDVLPAENAWTAISALAAEREGLHILLAHRPERIDDYLAHPFDLIVSGHAHGGQWRIPGIPNGLLAPNQGLFPQYAGGRYDFNSAALLVSRGLARESTKIPRIFNRPELVTVRITPAA